VLATAAILVILNTWFTDCNYLWFLTTLLISAIILCGALVVVHHHLLVSREIPQASTLLVIICLGWSILGTLSVSSAASIVIAKQRMDEAYKKTPLTLWHIVGGHRYKPKDAIYLPAGLPAHFQGEMDECHNNVPEMSIAPEIGRLTNGTYFGPKVIKEEQQITITVRSKKYHDTQTATIILLPDSPDIRRSQYPGEDNKKRKAIFDFIIISKNDSWVYDKDDFVERDRLNSTERIPGPLHRIPVCQPILALAGSHAFDPYVDVISIGTASREGKQTEEEGRAGRRSKKIAEWVNLALRNVGRSKHVYTMNLGQYLPRSGEGKILTPDDTAQERPVVLIGVVRDGEIDLEEALSNVFEQNKGNSFFNFLASHYPGRKIKLYDELPKAACSSQ